MKDMKEWEKAWEYEWKVQCGYKHDPYSGISDKGSFKAGWDAALEIATKQLDGLVSYITEIEAEEK